MGRLLVLGILGAAAAFAAWAALFWKRRLGKAQAAVRETSGELKAKNQLLSEEKRRVFAVLESMVEGVMVVGADKRILLANSAFARMSGFGRDDANGRHFWEIFRDPEINRMLESVFQTRSPASREHAVLLSRNVFQIQVSPVFVGSEFLGVAAVFHDVTKLKELERFRSEFVANVSHELKTPLTSIMGYVETLKEGVADDETRKRFLGIIEDHSKKLHSLIEDLLQLSRVESGERPLQKEDFDLAESAVRIFRNFERAMSRRGIRVSLDIEPKPFFLWADPHSLEQALQNLADNAVKYNRDGGEIFFRARREGSDVTIRIEDAGAGIPEGDLGRIFERFYRAEKSRSRETGGSGLGLSIAKHIIERHGGRIEAGNRPEGGAVFTVKLPAFTKFS